MPHPLEQGLRPGYPYALPAVSDVRVPHPLEQGLRHRSLSPFLFIFRGQSAPSIRTRIKTFRSHCIS